MMLDPYNDSIKQACGHVVAQRCLAAFVANVPGGVPPKEAAADGTQDEQPGIAAVRHQPKQQQIGAAGYRQRNRGGIKHRDSEKAQRSQVREPMRQQGVMWGRHWGSGCLTDEHVHIVLTAP